MVYQPKILLFDIETAPWRGWYYDQSNPYCILETDRESHMLSFAWQWLHEKKIHCLRLCDFDDYEPMSEDDSKLCEKLHELIDQADFVMGHNGANFDLKYTNARLIFHGFQPPSPYKVIDTLRASRALLKTGSNRLDALARYFNIGRKVPHHGKDMFIGCVKGEKKAWDEIKKYNPHDVWLMRELYYKLRPWMKHPNMTVLTGGFRCSKCSSLSLRKEGVRFSDNGTRSFQRLQCRDCGAWNRNYGEKSDGQVAIRPL